MNNFCSLPFRSLITFNSGEVKPCCDSQPMGMKQGANLHEVWNGESWKELRRSFAMNQRHAACNVCWNKEDKGFVSGRETCFTKGKALELCTVDGAVSGGPKLISLRLGNKCNLACIMCSPFNSSLWKRDQDIYQRHVGLKESPAINELDTEEEEFVEILHGAEAITFIGGEPLLFKQHEKILRGLIASGRASTVELHYFTNTTIIPDWCLDLWSLFRKIKLRSSIDGIGSTYDYIRYPAQWSHVEKNILKLTQHGLVNLDYSFCFVLMNLNIFSLEHFIIWRNEFFKGKTLPIIRPDYIENPVFLQAHYLPDKVKEQAVASLQRIVGLGCDEEKILAADMLEQVRAEPSDKLEKLAQLKNYLIDIDIRRRMDHKLIWDWL